MPTWVGLSFIDAWKIPREEPTMHLIPVINASLLSAVGSVKGVTWRWRHTTWITCHTARVRMSKSRGQNGRRQQWAALAGQSAAWTFPSPATCEILLVETKNTDSLQNLVDCFRWFTGIFEVSYNVFAFCCGTLGGDHWGDHVWFSTGWSPSPITSTFTADTNHETGMSRESFATNPFVSL